MPDISSVIIKLEEGFWQANLDRDVTFYEKHLAENAMVVTGFGAITKQEVLQSVLHAPIDYLNYNLTNKQVKEQSNNVALITYLATYDAKISNKPTSFVALCSTVYVKVDTSWQAVLHQETIKQ